MLLLKNKQLQKDNCITWILFHAMLGFIMNCNYVVHWQVHSIVLQNNYALTFFYRVTDGMFLVIALSWSGLR